MNLVNSQWVSVLRENGGREKIAPWQLAESENPVVDINAVRPDFQGGLYQFLIGLLQTTFAPADQDEWNDYWPDPPAANMLRERFDRYSGSFELSAVAGPRFLQDFDMVDGESKPISNLLIDAPGAKTLKDNLDHFVKGGQINGCCEACAATALFTLQTNAPSGGVGHRVGLRGGGPLTTLVLPNTPEATLWQKLWLNVLPDEDFLSEASPDDAGIFPWLAPTRVSDKNTGGPTFPDDVNFLQVYWGMPRRISLSTAQQVSGICNLCGEQSESLVTHFSTKNYGVNYEGPFIHPLTPYRFDPKKKNPPLTLKGQQGGLGYRQWLGLSWQDDSNGDAAAQVTQIFNEERAELLEEYEEGSGFVARLWCFGYDMDNMKARCWYEQQMPLLAIPARNREQFVVLVGQLLAAAKDAVSLLRGQVKAAWFSRPKDAKGDTSMIDESYWQATESHFFQHLNALAVLRDTPQFLPPAVAQTWVKILRNTAFELFDQWVLEGEAENMNMKRITQARRILGGKLASTKTMKTLDSAADVNAKEDA